MNNKEILSWTENWQRGNVIVHMNECTRKFSNKQDEFRAGGQNEDEDVLMDTQSWSSCSDQTNEFRSLRLNGILIRLFAETDGGERERETFTFKCIY